MAGRRSGRRILLAVRQGYAEERLLAAARGLCRRLEAALDILVLAPEGRLPEELAPFVADLRAEGLDFSLDLRPRLRRRDIVEYANTHECISTVVIDSLEGWESVAEDRSSDPWRRLACPLVTAARPAAPKPDDDPSPES